MPPAPPRAVERDASIAVSFGGGWLALNDNIGRDGQGAWLLRLRLAAGVAVNWMVFVGIEAGGTNREGVTFVQTTPMAGVQRFFGGRFYMYGGLGPSWVTESDPEDEESPFSVGPGFGSTVGLGFEGFRFPHGAVGLEASATMGLFAHERWDTGGVSLTFTGF
ncbi:MAG: hypothetical protein SF187_29685 [Deltaproteobacteria bacterium]|nr:hypothetical protein [Deltaproteobacteria bacterium]